MAKRPAVSARRPAGQGRGGVNYTGKHFIMTAEQFPDRLTVKKNSPSDWSSVEMQVHDLVPVKITLRSKEMAEQLHFMLGQMLRHA